MSITVSELADQLSLPFHGDGERSLTHIAPLEHASSGALSFVSKSRFESMVAHSGATALIVKPELADNCSMAVLISDDPYLDYARAAQLLYPQETVKGGIHPSAVIGQECEIPDSVLVDVRVTIGLRVKLGERVSLASGCVIGDDVTIGADTRIQANAVICHDVSIGERCLIHSCAVIGSDGFGFANDRGQWIKIPQVGTVDIGNDVEIGANTTIDRAAIDATVIGNGVKLDNLVQVAHNVQIGDHTAIAGCTGIAGSAIIGKYCSIGGGVGIVGHLKIADHSVITGQTYVAHNIEKPGMYSSGVPMQDTKSWKRNYVRFRQLDEMAKQITQLKKKIK